MKKAFFVSLFLLLAISNTSLAGEEGETLVDLRAFVDKSKITIAEKIQYTLEVERKKSIEVEFPPYAADLGGFALKDFGRREPHKSGKNRVRESQWYLLDTYTVGSYVIPPQTITVRVPGGESQSLTSPEIFVEVVSVLPEGEEPEGLKDIKFPLALPFVFPETGLIALVILLALGVGFILWRYLQRRVTREKPIPPQAAHEIALKELEKIEKLDLIQKGEIKEYYYLISSCMRFYVENRFGLRAPEQTTEEFLESVVERQSLSARYINLFKEYLSHCDLVKYAKLRPKESDSLKLMETTRGFIQETRVKEETVPLEGKEVKQP